jgi:hypothetical protein
MAASIPGFISSFEETFALNQQGLVFLVQKATQFEEFRHLEHKWPRISFSIRECPVIPIDQLLTPTVKVFELYIPVQFKLYKTFESQSHQHFELTLANQ